MYNAMEALKQFVLSNLPTSLLTSFLQMTFAMPVGMARALLADIIAPKPEHLPWIKMIEEPKWKGAWIGESLSEIDNQETLNRRIQEADIVIFKAHGGGFRVGTCTMYMDIFLKWISLLKEKHNMKALVLSIEYSLAPECTYPVPVLECVAAYEYLTQTVKVPPSKIVFSGDSAGGALCFETLIRTYAPNMTKNMNAPRTNFKINKPAGIFLVSPLIVSNTSEWSWNECKNDLVTHNLVTCILKEYMKLPDINPSDLHLLKFAHLRSGFERFAPKHVMFYYGGQEVMRTGIIAIAEAMQKSKSLNVVVRREEFHHDWYFLRQLIRNRDSHIVESADEEFASFAARAVKEYCPE